MDFDVIIIGAGPAGMSAAVWCDELGLTSQVFEAHHEAGGQLLQTHNSIDNHLGSSATSGREMRDKMLSQLEARGLSLSPEAAVKRLDARDREVELDNGDTFRARSIVLATGVRRRELGVPGEKRFRGKGIISSGKGEGESARGRTAVIVGGGDAAFENVLILSEFAESVTLVHRREGFTARDEFVAPATKAPNAQILVNRKVTAIDGDEILRGVELLNLENGERERLDADIVLIRIGVEPNADLVKNQVDRDDGGYIVVDGRCRTSFERVYAVGDVANPVAPTISSAVGMGATAAKDIFTLLNR